MILFDDTEFLNLRNDLNKIGYSLINNKICFLLFVKIKLITLQATYTKVIREVSQITKMRSSL